MHVAVTKIPKTGWLTNNRHLIFRVTEAGKSNVKVLADCLVRAHFLVDRQLSLHCVFT